MKAISAELQVQVDDLNDERVRLLKKLRDGAASAAVSSAATSEGVLGEGERGSGGQDPVSCFAVVFVFVVFLLVWLV